MDVTRSAAWRAVGVLCHPVVLLALVGLAINDGWLKGVGASLLTLWWPLPTQGGR